MRSTEILSNEIESLRAQQKQHESRVRELQETAVQIWLRRARLEFELEQDRATRAHRRRLKARGNRSGREGPIGGTSSAGLGETTPS